MAYNSDSSKKAPSKKKEGEILNLLDDYFQMALDDPSWKEARDEMVQCFDYKENRQWTKAELAELAARGQPPTVNNQVAVTIDRIVGQFVQVKTKTAFKPRNGDIDSPVASAMSDIYSYIRQNSGLSYEERDTLEDGATGGFGAFEVCIEDDPAGDPTGGDVIVKNVDCFEIYPDPRSRRYDWNQDARFICRAKWIDQDYAQQLYPAKKAQISGLFTDSGNVQLSNIDKLRGETYIDYKRDRIRLVEVQYKKIEDDGAGGREECLYVGVFCSGILFEHAKSKRKRYSFVPYFANRKKNGAPFSRITTAIPLQDAINKRESKALALLTMNQARMEKGAHEDKAVLRTEMSKPDGIIELEDGFFDKFEMDKNLELAQSQNQMHLQSKLDFRAVTGVNPDALGEKSEVRSGIGIQRKVAMTGLVIAPMFDNFKRTRETLAKTIHDAVSITYTGEKVLTITDSPKLTRSVILSNETIEAVKQAKYDIIITEDQDFDTVQEQQLDIISKTLPSVLQFGPGWAEVILEMSSIRDKETILQKVREVSAQAAPKPQPTMSFSAQLDKLSLPEKVFVYQKLEMPPELIKALLEDNLQPTQVLQTQAAQQKNQLEAQAEVQKTQQASQTEALKGQTEQVKAQAAQQKSQMDIQKSVIDVQTKRATAEHQIAAEREKAALQSQQLAQKGQLDMAGKVMDMRQAEHTHSLDMAGKKQDMQAKKQAGGPKKA